LRGLARRLTQVPATGTIRDRVRSLPKRFRRAAAAGIAAEWELRVEEETFTVSVVERRCHVREGPSLAPTFTVASDAETWLAVDDGTLPPPEALRRGRLGLRGNLDMAVRMQTLFRPFARPRAVSDVEQVEVEANGLQLSTYVYGPPNGPGLLWLHGLGATKTSWLPSLSPFAEKYRMIVPDLPGHGESEKPRTDYTPRYYARSMRKLLDAVGQDRAVVVGNSMGGRVALELAVRSPDRVRGLALLAPAVPGLRVRYLLGFMRIVPSEIGAIPFPVRERLTKLVISRLFSDPSVLSEESRLAAADEFIRIYSAPIARMAFLDSLRHILLEPAKPFWARVERIRTPALVVWGEDDHMLPVRLAGRLADALPTRDVLIMPNVGHVPQLEALEKTNAAMLKFLKRLPD
jgi:pimeloyl-ACP methyl ester carboxylesterase